MPKTLERNATPITGVVRRHHLGEWTIQRAVRTYRLGVLADCLDQWRPITPRLVEQARAEFEACVDRIPSLPPGKIKRGILTTQIGWEVEKLSESQKAAGA